MSAPLSNCIITRDADNTLQLNISSSGFHINLINHKKQQLMDICRDVLGKDIRLAIKTSVTEDNDHQVAVRQANQMKQEALRHPLVTDAVQIFNGTVVDVKLL